MLEEDKNLKNSVKDASSISSGHQNQIGMLNGHSFIFGSYTKTNKLVTALYMVTDILDNEEPLRNKLRSLGTDIISDTSRVSVYKDLSNFMSNKIGAIISLLDIARAMNLISEMNCNILKKEFIELKQSVYEFNDNLSILKGNISLSEFLKEDMLLETKIENNFLNNSGNNVNNSKGQVTRIGVQKGSTLLHALSKVEGKALKDIKEIKISKTKTMSNRTNFNNLKKERREAIIKIIKACPSNGVEKGATITDIKNSASGTLVSCGEKTLQRELVSMVQEGVLKKIGEKRWSKYFL
ncbi:MAG: hypothetical protein WC264_02585 [Candidatus Paceibacterota bacterium]|jgi:hypothetical protein